VDDLEQYNVDALRKEVSILVTKVESLATKVESQTSSIDDLVTAWKMAGKMVGFTKWAVGVATAFIGFWIALTKLKSGS